MNDTRNDNDYAHAQLFNSQIIIKIKKKYCKFWADLTLILNPINFVIIEHLGGPANNRPKDQSAAMHGAWNHLDPFLPNANPQNI